MTRSAALAAAVLLLALATACGGSGAAKPASAQKTPAADEELAVIKRQLVARLRREQLDFRWVVCLRNGRTYEDMRIARCNVDFGVDPHVEAYCSVLDHGKLITNHDVSAIPCRHDDAGWSTPIVSS